MQPIVTGQHWREQFRDLYVTHFDLCGDRLGRRRIHCVNLQTGRSTAIIEGSFRKYARLRREATKPDMVRANTVYTNVRSGARAYVVRVEWCEKKRHHVAVVSSKRGSKDFFTRRVDVLSLIDPQKYVFAKNGPLK
jgi:hypothetical protein